MKYAIPALFLLIGNEILSMAALTVIVFIFVADLLKEACKLG